MDQQTLGNKRGYALPLTIAIAALVAPLGLFALMQARVDLLLARHARTATQLFYVADSGLEHALADLRLIPAFDRLLAGPDGKEGTSDDARFPFRHNPQGDFPGGPFRYEVSVEQRAEDRVEVVSRALGKDGASQAVSASVMRDAEPMVAGTICSTISEQGFLLGDEFRISGIDRNGRVETIPALAVLDHETARKIRAQLSPEAGDRLPGAGGSPSVQGGGVPDWKTRIQSLLQDPRGQAVVADEAGSLGSGLLISRGFLHVERASGSGVLVVDGDLRVSESFSFTGLVMVLGDIVFDRGSTVQIRGTMMQEGRVMRLELLGQGEIVFDAKVIGETDSAFGGILPRRAIVAGWREVWE